MARSPCVQTTSERAVVGIVGAGLAGSLTAVQLLRAAEPVEVVLVERRGDFGPGVAYGTRDPHHLLNQPAARMSALPDDLDHFRRWAERCSGDGAPETFHPRSRYGDYLRELLDDSVAQRTPGSGLRRITGDVVSLDPAFRVDTLTGIVQKNVYQTVLNRMPDMSVGPGVASSYERVAPDKWRLRLREGLTFSNGEKVDALGNRFRARQALAGDQVIAGPDLVALFQADRAVCIDVDAV